MPSGGLRPSLTMVFASEPSGFTEITRPPLRSRKNRRPEVGLEPGFVIFDLETVVGGMKFACSFLSRVVRHSPSSEDEGCVLVSGKSGNLTGPVFYTKAPKPVIASPLWTPKKVARAVDPRNFHGSK